MESLGSFKLKGAFLLSILLTIGAHFASAAVLRIGYYGGTFDPVTKGHRQLVERAMVVARLDMMYIIPSITNSNKPNAIAYPLRKKLVQLGFKGVENVFIPDMHLEAAFEKDRASGVIRVLLKRHPGAHILKLTGDDVISRNFTDHIKFDPLYKNVGFIIGERSGKNQAIAEDKTLFNFENRELIILPKTEDLGISSSQVRNFLLEGNPKAQTLLVPEVYKVIKAQGLYPVQCDFILGKAG